MKLLWNSFLVYEQRWSHKLFKKADLTEKSSTLQNIKIYFHIYKVGKINVIAKKILFFLNVVNIDNILIFKKIS